MKRPAFILSVQTLQDLSTKLSRFSGEASQALEAVEIEIQRTLEFLQKRFEHWRQEVRRREQVLRQAERALRRCQSAVYHDRDGRPYHLPCTAEQAAVERAGRALEEAHKELENVRRWINRVNDAVKKYRREANRLRQLASTQTSQARAFLSRKHSQLTRYISTMGKVFGPRVAYLMLRGEYDTWRGSTGSRAVRRAKKQEIKLVRRTGRGTRSWAKSALRLLRKGIFPKGYHGHHINSVAAYPHLAGTPDNIVFLSPKEHLAAHHGWWGNPTSGKMFNRKSLMVQWSK